MLREKFTSMTQVKDGTIYLPPGGGVVASGHSLLAVRRANALLNLVRPAEDWVRENVELIASRIEKLTWVRPTRLRLQFQTELTLAMGRAVIWETTTRAEIMPDGPEPIVGILSGAA